MSSVVFLVDTVVIRGSQDTAKKHAISVQNRSQNQSQSQDQSLAKMMSNTVQHGPEGAFAQIRVTKGI